MLAITRTQIDPAFLEGSWWSETPLAKRLGATAAVATIGGATVGFFQADRPGVGILMGTVIGFLVWGAAWSVYTGYQMWTGIQGLMP